MSELAIKKFAVMKGIRQPPIQVEARNFKDFIETAGCRARTKTVKALRKGGAFFIESEKNPDSYSKSMWFGRINVALEAFRNMSDLENGSCTLHIFTHDNAQISYSALPKKDGLNGSQVRREFAKALNGLLSEGTVLVLSGNKAHAEF